METAVGRLTQPIRVGSSHFDTEHENMLPACGMQSTLANVKLLPDIGHLRNFAP